MDPKSKDIILRYVNDAFIITEKVERDVPKDLMLTVDGMEMTVHGLVLQLTHMFLRMAEEIGVSKNDLAKWGDALSE